MSGQFKECAECGRRFFSTDDSIYCSPSCFTHATTAEEREPSKAPFYIAIGCLTLLLFCGFETFDLNYFFLMHIPPLRNHAVSVFDESDPGMRYLHFALGKENDMDARITIVNALADCRRLTDYSLRGDLVDELEACYNTDDCPEFRLAVLKLFRAADLFPDKHDFLKDLQDEYTREAALKLMEKHPDIRFAEPLASVVCSLDTGEDFVLRSIKIMEQIRDRGLRQLDLVNWAAENPDMPRARLKAVKAIPKIIWPQIPYRRFKPGARARFARAIRIMRRLSRDAEDSELQKAAEKSLSAGRRRKEVFVRFGALEAFDKLFGKDEK